MKRLLLILLAGFSISACAGEDQRPNFLIVLVDDLGRQDVGVYGSSLHETPHMDQLAEDGMRFDNAYAAHPRCVPSRLGLMSGRYPASYGIPGFQDRSLGKHALPLTATTFAEILKDAGYDTGYIGKWHLGKEGGEPLYQGFDTNIMAGASGAPPSYFLPYEVSKSGAEGKGFEPYTGGERGEYLTDRLTDEALAFIETRKGAPFLLVLAHYAVHTPIQAKKEVTAKGVRAGSSLRFSPGAMVRIDC